jgi:hypothetical protein
MIQFIEKNGRQRFEIEAKETKDGTRFELRLAKVNGAGEYVPVGSRFEFGEKHRAKIKDLLEKVEVR